MKALLSILLLITVTAKSQTKKDTATQLPIGGGVTFISGGWITYPNDFYFQSDEKLRYWSCTTVLEKTDLTYPKSSTGRTIRMSTTTQTLINIIVEAPTYEVADSLFNSYIQSRRSYGKLNSAKVKYVDLITESAILRPAEPK